MPKVQPLERIHPDGTVEHGFVVLYAGHGGMEAPFFTDIDAALDYANDISARRQMGAVAL